jgi:hypothetical protein
VPVLHSAILFVKANCKQLVTQFQTVTQASCRIWHFCQSKAGSAIQNASSRTQKNQLIFKLSFSFLAM